MTDRADKVSADLTGTQPRGQDLASRTALVLGAGRGLGRGVALALEAAGAQVIAVARSAEQLDRQIVPGSRRRRQAEHGDDACHRRPLLAEQHGHVDEHCERLQPDQPGDRQREPHRGTVEALEQLAAGQLRIRQMREACRR